MLLHTLGWVVLLSALAGSGQAELELIDGRVLSGVEVRREGAVYVLTLESGAMVSMPVELVASVRLFLKGEPESGPKSETLAGDDTRPPTAQEQLEVFGEPARFQNSVISPSWTPTSDWDMDPERQNNFRPSTWQESPIDPTWQPTSDWNNDDDVLASGRSTWQKSPIDSEWKPTDGFATSVGR